MLCVRVDVTEKFQDRPARRPVKIQEDGPRLSVACGDVCYARLRGSLLVVHAAETLR